MVPFASFLTREYSLIFFWAHIQVIPFYVVFRNFNDFYLHKASVGEAHHPDRYFMLFFCLDNTAWHFYELRLSRSKCYKALFTLPTTPFSPFFRDLNEFRARKASVGQAHLPNRYLSLCFCPNNTAWHFWSLIWDDQNATRLYSRCQHPFFRLFSQFQWISISQTSVGQAHLLNRYFLLCFCPDNTAWPFSEPRLRRSKCYKAYLLC